MRTFNPGGGIYTAPPDIIAEFDRPDYETAPTPADMGRVALHLDTLKFSITRKCDSPPGYCEHCLCGGPQNLDMLPETASAFFKNNNIKYVRQVLFSGGNPPLNGEIIGCIAQEFVDRGIPFHYANAVIGGTFSQPLVDGLEKMRSVAQNPLYDKRAYITISTDQFHAPVDESVKQQYKRAGFPARKPSFKLEIDDLVPLGCAVDLLAKHHSMSREQMLTIREDWLRQLRAAIRPVIARDMGDGDTALYIPGYTSIEANGGMNRYTAVEWHEHDRAALCDVAVESIASALYRQGLVKETALESIFRRYFL